MIDINNVNHVLLDGSGRNVKIARPRFISDILQNEGYTDIYLRNLKASKLNIKDDFIFFIDSLTMSSEKNMLTTENYYKHKTLDFYININEDDEIEFLYYKLIDKNKKEIIDYLNGFNLWEPTLEPKVFVIVDFNGRIDKVECNVKPHEIDIDTMYNDDFRPVFDKIVDRLNNGDKGIIMLHGDPGTGKTNLIKFLTTKVPEKNFIFVPTNMIHSLVNPSFLGFLTENTNSVLILEDCEDYIKQRGISHNEAVSTLLNMSDGIMSDVLNIQIICTFNAKMNSIDAALLRKGRLIAEYEFKPLAKEKADKLAESLNIVLPKDTTLASIFNAMDEEFASSKLNNKEIGF